MSVQRRVRTLRIFNGVDYVTYFCIDRCVFLCASDPVESKIVQQWSVYLCVFIVCAAFVWKRLICGIRKPSSITHGNGITLILLPRTLCVDRRVCVCVYMCITFSIISLCCFSSPLLIDTHSHSHSPFLVFVSNRWFRLILSLFTHRSIYASKTKARPQIQLMFSNIKIPNDWTFSLYFAIIFVNHT